MSVKKLVTYMENENVDWQDIFKVLSHPIRSKIIESLYENAGLSYTALLGFLKIDTGQLNFHLRNMVRLYRKDGRGGYCLTEEGKVAYYMLKDVKKNFEKIGKPLEAPAPAFKRVLAAALDYFIFLSMPVFVVFAVSVFIPFGRSDPIVVALFLNTVFLFMFLGLASMEIYNGQTIGKYITGIRVVKENGMRINFIEGIFRNIAKVYLIIPDMLLGLIFFRKEGQVFRPFSQVAGS
ncbi:MAG: RDD family protein [Candidatus Hydrothermarchaeaceae archaeon]